jgi:hypothetical protein
LCCFVNVWPLNCNQITNCLIIAKKYFFVNFKYFKYLTNVKKWFISSVWCVAYVYLCRLGMQNWCTWLCVYVKCIFRMLEEFRLAKISLIYIGRVWNRLFFRMNPLTLFVRKQKENTFTFSYMDVQYKMASNIFFWPKNFKNYKIVFKKFVSLVLRQVYNF